MSAGRITWHKPAMILAPFVALYILMAIWLCGRLGLLSHLDVVVFSTADSRSYLAVSDYMLGRTRTVPMAALELRPFLFPLYLCAYRLVGPWGYLAIQWFCNIASIVLAFAAVFRLTRSVAASLAAICALASSLTFMLVALHGLSETFGILLTFGQMCCLAAYSAGRGRRPLYGGPFLAAASACVRPALLPCLLVWAGICVARIVQDLRGCSVGSMTVASRHACAALVALSPILAQLGFAWATAGTPRLSTAGQVNFDTRFFPAVYGFARYGRFVGYAQPQAAEARALYPTSSAKLRFMPSNSRAMLNAVAWLLRENLRAGSDCLVAPKDAFTRPRLARTLYGLGKAINAVYVRLHQLFIVLLTCVILLRPDRSSWLFSLCGGLMCYGVLVLSVLTYAQGDRIVLAAMPMWVTLYSVCGYVVCRRGASYLRCRLHAGCGPGMSA